MSVIVTETLFVRSLYTLILESSVISLNTHSKINLFFQPVPSENKKDLRSIEQTLADIQSKRKKQKVAHNADEDKEEYGEPSVAR